MKRQRRLLRPNAWDPRGDWERGLSRCISEWGNTSVITAASAMYPMLSVVLAVFVLRERLTRLYVLGPGFAAAAVILFSVLAIGIYASSTLAGAGRGGSHLLGYRRPSPKALD